MKIVFKIVGVVIALVLVLLLAATVLLKIYLPPEKAKKLVLEHLSTQLKREVKLGSVSVGILSGLSMSDLKISESPTFAKGTFLSSQQFTLKVALLPLLSRKVVVREILLRQPDVTVIRNSDGKTFNFSDLTSATTAPAPVPAKDSNASSAPFLLLVSHAEVDDAAVHFVDRSPAKQSLDIQPFNLKLKNVSLTAPFSLQTSMHVKSKGSDLAVALEGEANLFKGLFHIKSGTLSSLDSKVTLSGDVSGLKDGAPVVDMKIEIPQLDLSNFKGFVALPPALHVVGAFTGRADLSGNEKLMNFSALLDGAATQIQYGTSFSKPAKTALSLTASGSVKNLAEADLQNLKIVLGTLALSGHGKVQSLQGPQPTLALHVETNSFAIEDLLALAPGSVPAGVTLKGNNKLSADISGTATNAQFAAKWDGTALAVAQGDAFSKAPGFPLEVSIIGQTAGPQKIIVKALTAKLLNNQVTGVGTYETKGTQGILNFVAKGTNWSMAELAKVSPLLAPYHPTGTLSFEAHATGPTRAPQATLQTSADMAFNDIKHEYFETKNTQLKWNLTQITQDLSKVSGSASLRQGAGKIMNVEKLAAGSKIGKMALAPLDVLAKIQSKGLLKQLNLPSFQSIPFDSIVGDYLLHQGTMDIKTFNLNGHDLSIQDTGTVGLAGVQPINMKAIMKLAAGSIGGTVGSILQDENGRPTVKYTITGTVANPDAKPDLQEVSKKAVQEVGKELMKNKDVQNAIGDLQKNFKNIFH